MCRVEPRSHYQLSASTLLAPEAPITCTGYASTFFFATDLPPLSLACSCFWEHSTAQWPSCLHLSQGNFCFARSAPLFMDLLEFAFIELDFLSFSCATSAVASADANLSARNSIAQSFAMSKFTVCVLLGMVSKTSLKLSYSLPSVDKLRPVNIRTESAFSLRFANSFFTSKNCFSA